MNDPQQRIFEALSTFPEGQTLEQAQELIRGITQVMAIRLLDSFSVEFDPASSGGNGGGGTGPRITVVPRPAPPPRRAVLGGTEGTLHLLGLALNLQSP